MSRSVRDLRELVCVSRLTMREDEEDEDDLSRPMTSLSLFEESPSGGLTFQSPAHGYACPPEENHIVPVGAPQTVNDLVNSNNSSASLDTNMGLVKSKSCLPPVKSSKRPPLGYLESQSSERQGFYDDVLKHLEEETVRGWLQQANQSVTELSEWCHEGDNFVAFSHFWLAEFSLEEQLALVKLEISVLLDEIGFALQSAISARKIQEVDVKTLFSSLLPEYPTKLCSARGQYIFLNTLNTLSSGKTDGYKKLLTHVKLQTRLSSIAQRALSMRAYLVINLWKNVVQFYINIKNQTLSHAAQNDSRPQTPHSSHTDNDRIFQAVKRGNVRVLHYLLSNSFGSPNTKDSRGRSVALTSVLYNQPRVLKYLLAKHFDSLSLNEPCNSGNSPLHVAANLNHTDCLQLLLQAGVVNVNEKNIQCEGATALHLAVMQDNKEAVQMLLEAGADRRALMNVVSPCKLAEELGLEEMTKLLQE